MINMKYIKNKKRFVLFGIDGATWSLIKPFIKKGLLPNFEKLLSEGVHGNLRSVDPPVTCPAWATMLTGKNPATLDTFYFLKPNNKYELEVSPLDWKSWRPIWDILSDHGKRVIVFNIPTTIADKINGYFISGPIWAEEDSRLAYPPELNKLLKDQGYLVRPVSNPKITGDDIFVNDLFKLTEKKFALYYNYFKAGDWDAFIMSFNFGDTIQHHYWKYFDKDHPNFVPNNRFIEVLKDYFVIIDGYLGKILDNLPENAILTMTSDHGQMRAHTYVNLNAWLYKHGFFKIKKGFNQLRENKLKKSVKKGVLNSMIFGTRSYSRLIYLSGLINKTVFKNIQKRVKIWLSLIENKVLQRYDLKKYVDWNNTQAYSLTLNTIYLNKKGREINGVVSVEDYNKIRKQIIDKLKEFKDPNTGEKIIKDIRVNEEVYPQNTPPGFPDIYVTFNEGYINYYSDIQSPLELFSSDINFTGVHNINGIFLAYGPEIKSGQQFDNIGLEDIVPTILHYFEHPIPNNIDGRVLTEIFKPGSESAKRSVVFEQKVPSEKVERSAIRQIKFSKKI